MTVVGSLYGSTPSAAITENVASALGTTAHPSSDVGMVDPFMQHVSSIMAQLGTFINDNGHALASTSPYAAVLSLMDSATQNFNLTTNKSVDVGKTWCGPNVEANTSGGNSFLQDVVNVGKDVVKWLPDVAELAWLLFA